MATKLMLLTVAVALNLLFGVSKAEWESRVISLNDDNFDAEIVKYDYLLVEFFAPWCHHCVALAPEYEKAANMLATGEPPQFLAKVDATVNRKLSSRFNIMGYPTMIMFKQGAKDQDYPDEGSRKADGIAIWVLEHTKNKPVGKLDEHVLKKVDKPLNEDLVKALTPEDAALDDKIEEEFKKESQKREERAKKNEELRESKPEVLLAEATSEEAEVAEESSKKKHKCKGWNCTVDGVEIVSMNVILGVLIAVFIIILYIVFQMWANCKHGNVVKKKKKFKREIEDYDQVTGEVEMHNV